mmetsp:Transcript_7911/g.13339  ORF Transcript_7911/g.13339 Transcript_7911/m.13339 type:complete len:516 (+) Transcript_7911:51-1598(+)
MIRCMRAFALQQHRFPSRLILCKLFSAQSLVKVDYYNDIRMNDNIQFGDFHLIASNSSAQRKYTHIEDVGSLILPGENVWLRGRISSVRQKGNVCFAVLRSKSFFTLQLCHFRDKSDILSKDLIKYVGDIPLESIVDVYGRVQSATVKSCTKQNVEISIQKIFVVSRAPVVLPFSVEDASRSESDIDHSLKHSDRPFARVIQDLRLNNRWLDLRVPANNAIMRVKGGVSLLFREALSSIGFTEIVSPKILSGQSEGGSDVFTTKYFGKPACLAQSPQLYKQMALSADFSRVFEIGPVFRAENSNTRRHLCEYTGLDIEMEIFSHYNEVLSVLHYLFRYIFNGLEERYALELSVIRKQYPSEPALISEDPLIIHWHDAMDMLEGAGFLPDRDDDLSSQDELMLGKLVKEKYRSDFFALDQYPASVRPFYTMPNPDNHNLSNSYDLFIRGQEICSGGQRCHEPDMLEKKIKEKGLDPATLKFYIDSFRHGISPHGGGGIGLERVVFLYLGKYEDTVV